jgi:thymidylate synthase
MKTSNTGFASLDNARYVVPRNSKRMTDVVAPVRIEAMTLGEAWMAIAAAIVAGGVDGSWEGLPIVEVFRATLDVSSPRVDDSIIAQHGDPARLAWMHANFTDRSRVAELGDADSYATRLYDYAHAGRDQIRWVIERLAANPWARDATVTTFQPLTDTSYIPCVSLLDFWLVAGKLQLAAYANAIDFGTKGYANLVELAAIQTRVAGDLGVGVGTLTMTVKSAHIYQTELGLMRGIIAAPKRGFS